MAWIRRALGNVLDKPVRIRPWGAAALACAILLWHILMAGLLGGAFGRILAAFAAGLWHALGLIPFRYDLHDMLSSFELRYVIGLWLPSWPYVGIVTAFVLAEALFGWLGFRLLARKRKPRWTRFVGHWWRACLLATALLLLIPLFADLIRPAMEELFLFFMVPYGGVAPALLYRMQIRRRARRLGRCRHCGYWLRGVASPVCPECGTPIRTSGGQFGTRASRDSAPR